MTENVFLVLLLAALCSLVVWPWIFNARLKESDAKMLALLHSSLRVEAAIDDLFEPDPDEPIDDDIVDGPTNVVAIGKRAA